jgi:hypothetical protein
MVKESVFPWSVSLGCQIRAVGLPSVRPIPTLSPRTPLTTSISMRSFGTSCLLVRTTGEPELLTREFHEPTPSCPQALPPEIPGSPSTTQTAAEENNAFMRSPSRHESRTVHAVKSVILSTVRFQPWGPMSR